MCGRYTLAISLENINEYFDTSSQLDLKPRYNIAPSQGVLVVRQLKDSPRELSILRWGLIPSWMKEENISSQLINARAESVQEKPAFRHAFKTKRCIVVADGFYEWKGEGKGKQPYYISRKDKSPIAFAGLWEHWENKAGQIIESCAIITTEANHILQTIHERMPVVLEKNEFGTWLDPANQDTETLRVLLKSYVDKKMIAYPVGLQVNKPSHDKPDCIVPVVTKN